MKSDAELTKQAHELIRKSLQYVIEGWRRTPKEKPGEFLARSGSMYDVKEMTAKHFDHNDIIHPTPTKDSKILRRFTR